MGIDDRLPVDIVRVADWEREAQGTASRRGALRLLQTPGEDVQLGLGHGPLEAEKQPIIKIAQVVDAIGIHD